MTINENILALRKWESRRGHPVDGIILHSMGGFYRGTLAWYNNPDVIASAHYLISKNGEISKCVQEENASWHSGEVTVPYTQAPKILKDKWGTNPNLFTIGIEMEDENNKEWHYPQKQYFATVELVVDILKRHGKQPTADTILMHKDVNPRHRSDPIGLWDHNKFIEDVQKSYSGEPEDGIVAPMYRYKATVKVADWTGGMNIRTGASTSFDTMRTKGWFGRVKNRILKKGQSVNVIGFVRGERLSYETKHGTINTQFWWVTEDDGYIWSGGTAWTNGNLVKLTLQDFPNSINLQRKS